MRVRKRRRCALDDTAAVIENEAKQVLGANQIDTCCYCYFCYELHACITNQPPNASSQVETYCNQDINYSLNKHSNSHSVLLQKRLNGLHYCNQCNKQQKSFHKSHHRIDDTFHHRTKCNTSGCISRCYYKSRNHSLPTTSMQSNFIYLINALTIIFAIFDITVCERFSARAHQRDQRWMDDIHNGLFTREPVHIAPRQANLQQLPPSSVSSAASSSPFQVVDIIAQQGGTIKDRNVTFNHRSNPILITKDIIIKKDSKLTIEPGTELLFDKRKGIIVHGTLEILGSTNNKVKLNLMKSQHSATLNFRSQNNNNQNGQKQQVRLVDGDLPSEGRVQIKFNDRWHSLCTNSKNLTAADIKVLCLEVGYQEGLWYKWFPRRNDTTFRLMSKSFHCAGGETSITQCRRWSRVRAGGGVCDLHSDIGIRCSKTIAFSSTNPSASGSYDYWRGIEFINSETTHEYTLDGQMRQKVSKSNLRHLIITDAGLNEVGNATAAIRVRGQPPRMSDIEVKNSIYGIMMEDVDDALKMSNIKLINNMGYPLFINTSWGKVSLDNMQVENNGGDGIRVVRHERVVMGTHDFCKFANLGMSQSFPVVLSHEQTFFTVGRECCQEFLSNNQLTVHFPVLRSTPNNILPEGNDNRRLSVPPGVTLGKDASLVIYDDYRDEFPFRLTIQNSTRAQSIVSKSGRLKICYEPAAYRTVLFTVEVVADLDEDEWTGIARDVEISNSLIRNNDARGIWLDNPRSGIRIINTTVMNNNYIGGLHVENGTGEVIIQSSSIVNNTGHGIYVNLGGGYYHVDNSTLSGNTLKGMFVEYDKRPELVSFNHTFHLGYSLVANNGEHGIFIGNVCRSDALWNISMSSFIGNGEDAIHFHSCLPTRNSLLRFTSSSRFSPETLPSPSDNTLYQSLLITHNIFLSNYRRAINLAPVFFLHSKILNNLFRDHILAVLQVKNPSRLPVEPEAPANILIAANRFYSNRGRYVANIGLQEGNPKHSLLFTKNYLEDNYVTEPYADLRPRSRVSAVVVVSSTNAEIFRNRFDNPASSFEVGAHLEARTKTINATYNFWGRRLDAMSIYKRIFDRKNRYNLAQVEFLQYLLNPGDLEYASELSFDREADKIITFRNGTRLGGEVKGFEELPVDTYIVHDDIYIRSAAHLVLKPGTVLKFLDGVGMMVQGRLEAIGTAASTILFTSAQTNRSPQRTLITTTTPQPIAIPWISAQLDDSDNLLENNRISENSTSSSVPPPRRRYPRQAALVAGLGNVRLSHITMGRLEVMIDGVWGSVCDHNFDIDDAAVACQQLGMILNKDDWRLEKFQYASNDQQQMSMMSTESLMTNLRCDPSLDTDITQCKAEISSRGDFDGMCNSEVGIRCFPPSWSGVRLGMSADVSTLEHVTFSRAGMFDYASYKLKPALQIDFNRHILSHLNVRSNSDSGIGIIWNDVIGRHFSELVISDSKFLNNERHGFELKSRGLTLKSCSFSSNRQSGLEYNPTIPLDELDELLTWLHTKKNSERITTLSFPLKSSHLSFPSSEGSYRFFVFPKNPPSDLRESFSIGTDPGHMLGIHLLSPIQPESTESLNMSIGLYPESPVWDLRANQTSFPMISPGYKFHFNYSTGDQPRGNIVLYIRSRYNNRDLKMLSKYIPSHLVMPKFEQTSANINAKLINSLTITNSTVTKNGIGFKFRHPNYPFGDGGYTVNRRYANESTNLTFNTFEGNYFSAIFVGSDDFELSTQESDKLLVSPSEIQYNLIGNKMRRNKDCIRQFSRDLRYSYNVFRWTVNDTLFESNRGGGIVLSLPYYWRYDLNMSHSIDLNNNNFLRNINFELDIGGHFAILNLTMNLFKENRCRNRLITFNGMEKQFFISRNIFEYNVCNRLIDFNIESHADKMGIVPALFEYNSIRYNRRLITNSTYTNLANNFRYPRLLNKLHLQSSDYSLSLRGVQIFNITRNLFVNPELRYELVVAIVLDQDDRTIKVPENYWGSVITADINDRIFDFDDWNNYAIADFSPYLTQEHISAATIIAEPRPIMQTRKELGGRLTKSLTIPYRKEPYLVESDITVMPNVRLTIEKGVVLEFMPNVGMLVLGNLIAAGTRERPIQMRPMLSAFDIQPLQSYLYPPRMKPNTTHPAINDSLSNEHNYAFKHYQLSYPIDMGSVRLCKYEICNDGSHIYDNNVEDPKVRQEVLQSSNNSLILDGFLEIFNMTTLQWVPVCDPLFTEHSAKVVCKQLGYTHFSLYRRGRRYSIEPEQILSVRNWPESVQCEGTESNLSGCPLAGIGFSNHSTACHHEGNQFVYVYCRDFPEHGLTRSAQIAPSQSMDLINYWGGIRFSCTNTASSPNINDINVDTYSSEMQQVAGSRLNYVSISRAGMLHGNRGPAIQVLQCNVPMEFVAVSNSAHHGFEVVTSHGNLNFHQFRLRDNLGIGFNYLALTGSSSAGRLVPYLPLKHLDSSNDMFGMVNICGASKVIHISERLLLFYRYSSHATDCIKIITSSLNVKHLGIRMLQFDLVNSTAYTSKPDYIKIYDGNVLNLDSRLLVDMGVTERHRVERPELKFYQSSDSTISVRLHVTGGSPLNGFIAEVVTTPVSYNIQRDTFNNITFSEITNNKMGALTVSTAGESSPNLLINNNRIDSNCLHLFGNFTSCPSPVYMELQNCQRLRVTSNLIRENQGGIMTKSYSHSAVSALDATFENNIIEGNRNTHILALLGPKTDPYQSVKVLSNIITRNLCPYFSNIVLSRIVANFSNNIVSSNIGKHQIEVIGFDKMPLSYQKFTNNWIYNNTATYERDRSTIFGNSAGQQYFMNYLVNPDNHFEVSTMNWSRYDVKPLYVPREDEIIHLASGDGSNKDLFRKTVEAIPINVVDTKKLSIYHASINARQNWWGFNTTSAIQNRIRDRVQHEELIKVEYVPYLETNHSVLSDLCAGGWRKLGGSCLLYVGSRMTYQEARDFCDRERAALPLIRGNYYELSDLVESRDHGYDPKADSIWIRTFDVSDNSCPVLNDFRIKSRDCQDKYSFLCEKDPQIVVSWWPWYQETVGIIALVLALITTILALCCTICWGYKSRQRYKERLNRKSTIYASMRSNRHPFASNTSLGDLFMQRQIYSSDKLSVADLSLSTQLTAPSNEPIAASSIRLDPNYEGSSAPRRTTSIASIAKRANSISPTPVNSNTPQTSPQYLPRAPSSSTRLSRTPSQDPVRTITPAPSYREIHPRAMSLGGSRTSSNAGSLTGEPSVDPMPIIPDPPPLVSYSQITHALPAVTTFKPTPQHAPYRYHFNQENLNQQQDNLGMRDSTTDYATRRIPIPEPRINMNPNGHLGNDESTSSSVPTYYSDQGDTYEESTQSYLESYNIYNDTYRKALERMNDQTTYVINERSSITDLLLNESSQTTQGSTIDSQADLISMKPQGTSDIVLNREFDRVEVNHINKAFSEIVPLGDRYWTETSFDLETPRMAPLSNKEVSMYNSSQRLSPVSSTFGPADSKLGSRVYLETSFE